MSNVPPITTSPIVVVTLATVIVCLAGCSHSTRSGTSAANNLFATTGQSTSPNGLATLQIDARLKGIGTLAIVASDEVGDGADISVAFNKSDEMFASWDDRDRLWVYQKTSGVKLLDVVGGTPTMRAPIEADWLTVPDVFVASLPADLKPNETK